MMRSIQRPGFSLVELLAVIGIIGVLMGLILPAVQSMRESARTTTCLDRLRQLAVAATNYEAAHQSFPAGTLGFADYLAIPYDLTVMDWQLNPSHQFYWKKTQHTSSLVYLLPYLEGVAVWDQFPQSAVRTTLVEAWPGEHESVMAAAATTMTIWECPSDTISEHAGAIVVATQPRGRYDGDAFEDDAFLAAIVDDHSFQPTNYLACSGAHSGGDYKGSSWGGYRGVFGSRHANRANRIRDGLSQTILYGESIGTINDGRRMLVMSWAFGGLARGRGAAPWGAVVNPHAPILFLGDSQYAYVVGFGSKHPATVNVCRADGSVHAVSRLVDLQTWYQLCGRADGRLISQ